MMGTIFPSKKYLVNVDWINLIEGCSLTFAIHQTGAATFRLKIGPILWATIRGGLATVARWRANQVEPVLFGIDHHGALVAVPQPFHHVRDVLAGQEGGGGRSYFNS